MGTGKKEATRRQRQGKSGDGMGNVKVKGENFYRYAILSKSSNKEIALTLILVMPKKLEI